MISVGTGSGRPDPRVRQGVSRRAELAKEDLSAVAADGVADVPNRRTGEGGFSLVETSITLFLLMTIAAFGLQTMTSAWMLENSSIVQSMTDAQAAIETAYAQRWVFAAIPSSDVEANPDPTKTNLYTLWPLYPASNSVGGQHRTDARKNHHRHRGENASSVHRPGHRRRAILFARVVCDL